jgi:hypothetical protein
MRAQSADLRCEYLHGRGTAGSERMLGGCIEIRLFTMQNRALAIKVASNCPDPQVGAPNKLVGARINSLELNLIVPWGSI